MWIFVPNWWCKFLLSFQWMMQECSLKMYFWTLLFRFLAKIIHKRTKHSIIPFVLAIVIRKVRLIEKYKTNEFFESKKSYAVALFTHICKINEFLCCFVVYAAFWIFYGIFYVTRDESCTIKDILHHFWLKIIQHRSFQHPVH